MRRRLLACLALTGCTGMTLGENTPGQDTPLDPWPPTVDGEHVMGSLAVEQDEDHVWVVHEERRGTEVTAHLAAVDPVTRVVTEVMDVTGTSDRRVMFPGPNRMLLMAQRAGQEHLVLFDTRTFTPLVSAVKPTWYWGTRRSPSGRFAAVADNADPLAPIHVIDLKTLAHRAVPHGGTAIEAMWNRTEDRLLAVSATDPFGPSATATILRWDLRAQVDLGGDWPAPELEIPLPGYGWDFAFSFTWIGVSPDGRFAVFPLREVATGDHVLVVLDEQEGTTRVVPGRGPVGFTPDSSTIVSYGYDVDGQAQLWMIDPVTLASETVPVGIPGALSFFVTWDGTFVVCTSPGGGDRVVIYDPDTGESVTIDGTRTDLLDFVTRPGRHELWLETAGALQRLALDAGTIETVTLPFLVSSVNIRPVADELVLGERDAAVWRFAMDTATTIGGAIELPSPVETPARATLP